MLILINGINIYGENSLFYYIALLFIFLYYFYFLFLRYLKFNHILKTLKYNKLKIKDIKADLVATTIARYIFCIKGFLVTIVPCLGVIDTLMGVLPVLPQDSSADEQNEANLTNSSEEQASNLDPQKNIESKEELSPRISPVKLRDIDNPEVGLNKFSSKKIRETLLKTQED
jgi:hypothetical protein